MYKIESHTLICTQESEIQCTVWTCMSVEALNGIKLMYRSQSTNPWFYKEGHAYSLPTSTCAKDRHSPFTPGRNKLPAHTARIHYLRSVSAPHFALQWQVKIYISPAPCLVTLHSLRKWIFGGMVYFTELSGSQTLRDLWNDEMEITGGGNNHNMRSCQLPSEQRFASCRPWWYYHLWKCCLHVLAWTMQ